MLLTGSTGMFIAIGMWSCRSLCSRGRTALPLQGLIDLDAQPARLTNEMQQAESDIAPVDQKLNNPKFAANADEEVVAGERAKREEAVGRRQKITEALERLQNAK